VFISKVIDQNNIYALLRGSPSDLERGRLDIYLIYHGISERLLQQWQSDPSTSSSLTGDPISDQLKFCDVFNLPWAKKLIFEKVFSEFSLKKFDLTDYKTLRRMGDLSLKYHNRGPQEDIREFCLEEKNSAVVRAAWPEQIPAPFVKRI
jgi:hypothetical protein